DRSRQLWCRRIAGRLFRTAYGAERSTVSMAPDESWNGTVHGDTVAGRPRPVSDRNSRTCINPSSLLHARLRCEPGGSAAPPTRCDRVDVFLQRHLRIEYSTRYFRGPARA